MTSGDEISESLAGESRTDRALRAYLRAVILAEPVQYALIERHGVRLFDLRALRILRDLGEVPISRLADELEIPRSTATGLIDRLEKRGLTERVACSTDRRVILVGVTEHGRQALENRDILQTSLAGRAIAALPPALQDDLAVVLERLVDEARAQHRAALEPVSPTVRERGSE